MKIKSTYSWLRRDFSATLQCESCGHEQEQKGCYDDRNYYDNVIPNVKCKKCGESTVSLGNQPDKPSTKYPENLTL